MDLNALYFLSWQAPEPDSTSEGMGPNGWIQKEQVPISVTFRTVLECYSFRAKWHKPFPLPLSPPLGARNFPTVPFQFHRLSSPAQGFCFASPLLFPVYLDTLQLDEPLAQPALTGVAGEKGFGSILIPRKTLLSPSSSQMARKSLPGTSCGVWVHVPEIC